VVAADAQAIFNDLQVGVAVADMPSEAKHVSGAPAFNFYQRLRRPSHFNYATVVEHETITIAQRDRAFQIEQEGRTLFSGQHDAPTLAIIRVENYAIDRLAYVP
jgi:hypothetical protein